MEDIIIILGIAFNLNLPLLTAWLLDHWLGDPAWLPHPVVAFGKAISFCEHRLNKGNARFLKGAAMSLLLVAGAYLSTLLLLRWAASYSPGLLLTLQVLLIFYCLAGTTLVREVCEVFKAVDRSLEEEGSRWPALWDATPPDFLLRKFVRLRWRRWRRI